MKDLYRIKYNFGNDLKNIYLYATDENDAEIGFFDNVDEDGPEIIDIEKVWQGRNDNYYCENCKEYIETPYTYTEMHGFTYGNGETFIECPCCHGDIWTKERYENHIIFG